MIWGQIRTRPKLLSPHAKITSYTWTTSISIVEDVLWGDIPLHQSIYSATTQAIYIICFQKIIHDYMLES